MSNENNEQHSKEQPIIIKKIKKGGAHGHHGGAWKVAYADFVTAMMAFFIVMWILASSAEVKEKVSDYFNNPMSYSLFTGEKIAGKAAVNIDLGLEQKIGDGGKGGKDQKGEPFVIKFDQEMSDSVVSKMRHAAKMDSIAAAERVEEIGNRLTKTFNRLVSEKPELETILSSIKIEMTNEGLRIELIESSEALFFEIGSDELKSEALKVLKLLASEIGKLPNHVEIEGHTDSRSFGEKARYSNWELSTDRANSARRVLETSGMWEGQISKVTGYSDKKLRTPENPFEMSNRRVSILIKQITANEFLPDLEAELR